LKTFEFACGGTTFSTRAPDARRLELDIQGGGRNVNLRISDVSHAVASDLPDLLLDVLDVAAYVYCADQRAGRGTPLLTNAGSEWSREMRFSIPVRRLDVWQDPSIAEALVQALTFLSDDDFEFEFRVPNEPLPAPEAYFPEFGEDVGDMEEMLLFSGGIDSLAGAVETLLVDRKRAVLIGHHSATKVLAIQKDLVWRLRHSPECAPFIHVPVNVTNKDVSPVESTQRTRSFLFASIAFVLTRMFGKDHFTFFENGVVSFNLPPSGDVLGSRATRTTHPRSIVELAKLFTLLAQRSFEIRTPYLWLTKTEVVQRLMAAGHADLIPISVSCTKPRQWNQRTWHCGVCSQCIDRRFGILAAGAGNAEPHDAYAVELFKGLRTREEDLRMAVAYVRHCQKLATLDKDRFSEEFPEVYAAIDDIPGLATEAALARTWDTHRRHAEGVLSVIACAAAENAAGLLRGEFPAQSLLPLCFSRAHFIIPPSIDTYAEVAALVDRLEAPHAEFAIDAKRVCFRGGLDLTGTDFQIVDKLLPNHRDGKRSGTEVRCILAPDLAAMIKTNEETMRHRVKHVRGLVNPHVSIALGIPVIGGGFIENVHGKGYRISPEFREVALGDLQGPAALISQISASPVTNLGRQA
jgi:hypothetical protein